MAQNEFHEFPSIPAATGASDAVNTQRFEKKSVQIFGTFVATLDIEGSLDGSNWFILQTGIAAASLTDVPEFTKFLRLNLTAYTSGAVEALIGGFDPV